LAPLAQRLATDFTTERGLTRQKRCSYGYTGFDLERLGELGRGIRDLYIGQARNPGAHRDRRDDAYVANWRRP